MFEDHSKPLVPRAVFLRRMVRHGGYAVTVMLGSMIAGTAGFHYLAGQSTLDAWLNAAMLLGGMGPVGDIQSTVGKLFASVFALYAGLVFVAVTALLLAPVLHRFLHHFHAADRQRSGKS